MDPSKKRCIHVLSNTEYDYNSKRRALYPGLGLKSDDPLIGTVQVWVGEGDKGRVNWLYPNGVYNVGSASGELTLGGGSEGEYKVSFSLTPKK